jgi:hypothetical protein
MIVDEPAEEFLFGRKSTHVRSNLKTEPFQGGYNDFINYDSLEKATATSGPPRSSMFDDLCYYHKKHADLVKTDDNPHSVAVFLKKIIASHYMLLAEYNHALLEHLEWLLSRREDFGNLGVKWVEERWSDLQSSNRRCESYHRRLRSIIRELRIERKWDDHADWTSVSEDFLVLEELFRDLKKKAEGLVSSFTGLAQECPYFDYSWHDLPSPFVHFGTLQHADPVPSRRFPIPDLPCCCHPIAFCRICTATLHKPRL